MIQCIVEENQKTIELEEDVFKELERQAKERGITNEEMLNVAMEGLRKNLNARRWMEAFGKAAIEDDQKTIKEIWPKGFNFFGVFLDNNPNQYAWRSHEYRLIFSPTEKMGKFAVELKIGEVGILTKTEDSVSFRKKDDYQITEEALCQIGTKTILGKKFKICIDLEKKLIPID